MNEIKTLADQLRSKMATKGSTEKPAKKTSKPEKKLTAIPDIVEALRAYDVTNHKTLIHARVDAQTAQMIHHLKIATGIEVTRLICFSIRRLFEQNPELKTIIKEHLQNFEL